jgi:hypothetical protein
MIQFLQALPLIGGLWKTVVGDKSESNKQAHNEQMAVYNQFAAEFGHSKTWWDSLIDGLNRLPRPFMTFGVFALFIWCARDPVAFTVYATALQAMPPQGWTILGIVIAFWFGSKVPKDFAKGKLAGNMPSIANEVAVRMKQKNIPPSTQTEHETGVTWEDKRKARYETDWDNLNN